MTYQLASCFRLISNLSHKFSLLTPEEEPSEFEMCLESTSYQPLQQTNYPRQSGLRMWFILFTALFQDIA